MARRSSTASAHLGALLLVSLALGFTIWPQMARYVRGQTLQLKGQQFVEAARSVGATNRAIILRHIVPNLFNIVLTAATLDIVGIITAEATLSLLGLGVQAPGSSLGLMISDSAGTDLHPVDRGALADAGAGRAGAELLLCRRRRRRCLQSAHERLAWGR